MMSDEQFGPNVDALNALADEHAQTLKAIQEIRDLVAIHIYDDDGHDLTPDHTALLWLVKVDLPDIIGRIIPMREEPKLGDGEIPF